AGRLLPGRTGRARRAARLVAGAGAAEPERDAAVPGRHNPHRLQRQRPHHLPGDAGARSGAQSEVGGGRGSGHGRRLDGDRQRTESRRTGAARPLLRRRRPPVLAVRRRAAADACRHRGLPADLANRTPRNGRPAAGIQLDTLVRLQRVMLVSPAMTAEQQRLDDDARAHWKRWGPYLSERAWGTVREDYSARGTPWEYFPHDHARSR